MEPIIIFMLISFIFMFTVLFIDVYSSKKSIENMYQSNYKTNNLYDYFPLKKNKINNNYQNLNKYFGQNTKCFSCERQMISGKRI